MFGRYALHSGHTITRTVEEPTRPDSRAVGEALAEAGSVRSGRAVLEARMRTGAAREMPVGAARDVEAVGVAGHVRISIRRSEEGAAMHSRLEAVLVDLDVLGEAGRTPA